MRTAKRIICTSIVYVNVCLSMASASYVILATESAALDTNLKYIQKLNRTAEMRNEAQLRHKVGGQGRFPISTTSQDHP